MNGYNYKWIDFLSNGNAILVENEKDFQAFKELLERQNILGCLKSMTTLKEWQYLARINGKESSSIFFEYNNSKGLTFDVDKERVTQWYEKSPYTIKEILEELQEEKKQSSRFEYVKQYMKEIEELEDYRAFEAALLISERTDLTHTEITEELVNEIDKIASNSEYLIDELLRYKIDQTIENFNEKDKTKDYEEIEKGK